MYIVSQMMIVIHHVLHFTEQCYTVILIYIILYHNLSQYIINFHNAWKYNRMYQNAWFVSQCITIIFFFLIKASKVSLKTVCAQCINTESITQNKSHQNWNKSKQIMALMVLLHAERLLLAWRREVRGCCLLLVGRREAC